jgi:bacillithiol synthase
MIPAMAAPVHDLASADFLRHGAWDRDALTRILRAANSAQERPVAAHLTALSRPDGVAIVTGQQPAVGGGPLYSLVKIAHAIAIARALGTTAAPVFWCASEDHDLGEAGHADVIARDGTIHRFSSTLGGGRASLRFRPAVSWWDDLVRHCHTHLGDGLGHSWLEAQRPHADEGMGAWTCRLLRALFARHGLLCIEGHQLRPLWRERIRLAIDSWPVAALADLRQNLLDGGASDAFGELAVAPLFIDRADGRQAVQGDEARAVFAHTPDDLSPGAALRPILQQAALPTLAYVGGPGELAYHRFITPLYGALGVPPPQLIPRCSLSLLPSWVSRGLERWQVTADEVSGPAPSLPAPSAAWLAPLDAAFDTIARHSLPAAQERRRQAGLTRLRRERDRLAASLARGDRQAAERPAWGALQGFLQPRGARQERTLSLFQVVWQFGPGIADRLVESAASTAPGVHGWVDLR